MRRVGLFVVAVALTLAFVLPAQAQFARAGLQGAVTDPDGVGLPGVTVTAVNDNSGASRTSVTAGGGGYNFAGMTPGMYTVTFSLQGFTSLERQNIQLLVGQTGTLNITLVLGSVEETITVTAQTPLVEVASKEIGGSVTTSDFEDLPSQNRSFVMFARLLPGVNANPSTESTASDSLFVNGQDDNNNFFAVDGAANEDDVIGARAGAQTRTAIDAIQEFQILTTQFDAEFGRTTGGVLNAVTKSGGNDFHGTGFLYLQSYKWNSPNFFTERNDLDKPEATYSSLGGTVGGPIVENRAHFFVSLELNRPNQGVARNFETRPDKNFSTTEENQLRNYLFKFDGQMTDSHKLSVRYLREYSPQFNQIIGGNTTLDYSREEDDLDQNMIGSVDSVLSDRAFNNLRISWTQEDVWFANPCYNNNGQDFATQRACDVAEWHPVWNGGTNTTASGRINNSYQFDDTFSLYMPDWKGDHDMRAGVNYSHRTADPNSDSTANGAFDFDNDADWDFNNINTYPLNFRIKLFGSSSAIPYKSNNLGLFFQDDWQPIENLTLNLGLRYDRESITQDNNNLAPRLGFAWDPTGDGRTVVRGGWGRFYERFQMGVYGGFLNNAIEVTQGQTGRVPGSGDNQQLLWDIAHNNNLTSLNALRDHLAAMLESGAATLINLEPDVDSDSRRSAYADTLTIGVEREVVENLSLAADFIHTQNRNILHWASLNPWSNSMGGRPNISIYNGQQIPLRDIWTILNAGSSNYDSLQLQLKRRMGDSPIGRFSGRISYTYANQSGNSDAQQVDQSRFQMRTETGWNFDTNQIIGEAPNLNLEHPQNVDRPSPWHRQNMLVLSWAYQVPSTSWRDNGGLMINGIWEYREGDRWEVLERTYMDNDWRAISPPGSYTPNITSDIAQDPVDFNGKENGAQNDPISRLDLSFRYRVPFSDQYDLTIVAEWFNIMNNVNMAGHGSSYHVFDNFLIPSSAYQPREFQIGLRFTY